MVPPLLALTVTPPTDITRGATPGQVRRKPSVWDDAPVAATADAPETDTLEWCGRTVAWSRRGTGPPVVLCHGTPWSSRLWEPIAAALATDFTVHLWDIPGYGASSMHPAHAVDLGVQGRLLVDLLDHWGLDSPHVVAHDYGGAVALRATLLHGARLASLCLVDVVALRPWGSDFFRLVGEHAEVFTRLPPVIHRAVVEAYVRGGRATAASRLRSSRSSSPPGSAPSGSPPSTDRSRRRTNGSPPSSSHCSPTSTAPPTSSGLRRTPGSPSTARTDCSAPSRAARSPCTSR